MAMRISAVTVLAALVIATAIGFEEPVEIAEAEPIYDRDIVEAAEPEPETEEESWYCEPEPAYRESYGDCLTVWGGVYWNEETGLKETWYSQNVLPGGGLDIPGRHVNEQGLVCDADGYICVASDDYSYGTVVETSLGTGKVYDCGCASGTLDVYTNW